MPSDDENHDKTHEEEAKVESKADEDSSEKKEEDSDESKDDEESNEKKETRNEFKESETKPGIHLYNPYKPGALNHTLDDYYLRRYMIPETTYDFKLGSTHQLQFHLDTDQGVPLFSVRIDGKNTMFEILDRFEDASNYDRFFIKGGLDVKVIRAIYEDPLRFEKVPQREYFSCKRLHKWLSKFRTFEEQCREAEILLSKLDSSRG
ncbi:hypothetical protein V5799_017945 [Amblyomma americanum]|uniref:Uncharacterized protein n=1 Tax=Amblyomma americanum TaxID=6943 RepID=A0AAQ4F1W9_AMBAM